MPGKAQTPEQARGAIRRLERIVATPAFQDAVDNFYEVPQDKENAKGP